MHRSVPTSVNRVSTEHRSHNCNPSLSFPCPSFILPSPCLPVRRRASLSHLPFLYRTFSLYYFLQSDFAGRSSTISLSPSFSCLFASPARHLFFLFIRAVFFSLDALNPRGRFSPVSARFQTSSNPACFAHSKLFAAMRAAPVKLLELELATRSTAITESN